MRALVVIATVTKAISHLVARAQERVGVFREHLLGMSWPQEAVCTQGDGGKGVACPLDTCPGLHTHIQSHVYMQLWSPIVPRTWSQLCTITETTTVTHTGSRRNSHSHCKYLATYPSSQTYSLCYRPFVHRYVESQAAQALPQTSGHISNWYFVTFLFSAIYKELGPGTPTGAAHGQPMTVVSSGTQPRHSHYGPTHVEAHPAGGHLLALRHTHLSHTAPLLPADIWSGMHADILTHIWSHRVTPSHSHMCLIIDRHTAAQGHSTPTVSVTPTHLFGHTLSHSHTSQS